MMTRLLWQWLVPACCLLVAGFSDLRAAEKPAEWIERELPNVMATYRHLHQHPELSFHERETAAYLVERLREAGFEVTTDVGGHGFVAVLKNGPGPCVMLRTDLDALPVAEQTGLPFASQVTVRDDAGDEVGVMHACGHDLHMANLLATARYLSVERDRWQGTLLMLGQPAEERGAGAKAMLEDGLLERFPRPDFALAAHVDATLPAGVIGYRGGYMLANVDSVDITLFGRGGHGAHPESAVDPIVMAAALVLDLQTIVSRELSALEPGVVTVGSIHGGTKHNIIPDRCQLQLTVRSYSDEAREKIRRSIVRKAEAVSKSFGGGKPEVTYSEGTPALANDLDLVQRVVPAFADAIGADRVVIADQSMGGEDFARYGKAGVPICMFRIGATSQSRIDEFAEQSLPPPGLHSPLFYPDAEVALRTGFLATTSALMELLPKAGARSQ